MGAYVDVTGISDEYLSLMGYVLFQEDGDNQFYDNKGDVFILPKQGKRNLYVEDLNDVPYLKAQRQTPLPPWTNGSLHSAKSAP